MEIKGAQNKQNNFQKKKKSKLGDVIFPTSNLTTKLG